MIGSFSQQACFFFKTFSCISERVLSTLTGQKLDIESILSICLSFGETLAAVVSCGNFLLICS